MEQQRKEIDFEMVKSLMDEKYHLVYVDYNDNLDDHHKVIARCIEEKSADHLYQSFNDWYSNQEYNNISDVAAELKKRLVGAGYKRWEAEKFFEENEYEIRDEICSRGESDDVDKLLRNTRDIPVRIEMLSSFDCINSHWFEGEGGFSYEGSYFGDMIDALWLNPSKVERLLESHGDKVCGHFPDRKWREGKELVSYEQFYEEHINSSCGANLLTFMATLNPSQLYEAGFQLPSKLTIPVGNKCGLFSSTYGGGSIIEMELQRDMTVDLQRSEYPKYSVEFEAGGRGYSIRQVYGLDRSCYGKPIQIDFLTGRA